MESAERWVDYKLRIALDIQERQGTIRRVETIDIYRMLGFGSARTVSKLVKITAKRKIERDAEVSARGRRKGWTGNGAFAHLSC